MRHDLRPLVLKTVLTYLELDGVLRQGTPFYAGYRLRPLGDASLEDDLRPLRRVARRLPAPPVATGKTGRTWTTLAPDDAAAELGEERSRIVAALEYLDQQGLVELQPAEVRQRYTLLARPDSERRARRPPARALRARASRRRPAGSRACSRSSPTTAARSAALVGYFGETRTEPCGHCTPLPHRTRPALPEPEPKPPIEATRRAPARSRRCATSHPARSARARQQARFLAGITSPATTRARLTRDPLFGSLADRRFADVLAWCETAIDP